MQLQRTQLLLVFALLGLGRRAALGQSSEPRLFIDDNGDICSDTVEVVQKLEYDEQVHCKVRGLFSPQNHSMQFFARGVRWGDFGVQRKPLRIGWIKAGGEKGAWCKGSNEGDMR